MEEKEVEELAWLLFRAKFKTEACESTEETEASKLSGKKEKDEE